MAAKSEGKVAGKEAEEKSKKRGPYKRAECPYCGKVKGNLKNHILQAHPVEAAQRAEAAPALDKGVLTGEKKPGEVEIPAQPGDTAYYCMDCRAELRKGEKECWQCGAALAWENIE